MSILSARSQPARGDSYWVINGQSHEAESLTDMTCPGKVRILKIHQYICLVGEILKFVPMPW